MLLKRNLESMASTMNAREAYLPCDVGQIRPTFLGISVSIVDATQCKEEGGCGAR